MSNRSEERSVQIVPETESEAYKQKKRQVKRELASAKKSTWEEWKRSLTVPQKTDVFSTPSR